MTKIDKKDKKEKKEDNGKIKRKALFLEIIKRKIGNISSACNSAGISRETFYRWLREDPKFKSDYEDMKESILDLAESFLLTEMSKGNITATIFFLKCKGKERGYVERQELAGVSDKPITIVVRNKFANR